MGGHDAVEPAITMASVQVITMAAQVITMPWYERSRWSGPGDHDAVESVATIARRAQTQRCECAAGHRERAPTTMFTLLVTAPRDEVHLDKVRRGTSGGQSSEKVSSSYASVRQSRIRSLTG